MAETPPSRSRFWLVWNPNAGPPTHRHATAMAAANEAERLAALAPGTRFYVLESLGSVMQAVYDWEYANPKSEFALEREIPF